jgi:hypothetical protein
MLGQPVTVEIEASTVLEQAAQFGSTTDLDFPPKLDIAR